MIDTGEVALPFGKYRGWHLSAVVARDPDYCRWLLKQPFVQREFPALHVALDALALPKEHVRTVRVERRTFGSCEVYTFPAERIVRRPPATDARAARLKLFDL
jgi:uncharacterized protein (DUF3820 family)